MKEFRVIHVSLFFCSGEVLLRKVLLLIVIEGSEIIAFLCQVNHFHGVVLVTLIDIQKSDYNHCVIEYVVAYLYRFLFTNQYNVHTGVICQNKWSKVFPFFIQVHRYVHKSSDVK